ncbi:patatin-like phospholipase family protein [Aliivibrio sp. S4TY2]|uniref:patatin-like phospholipase family protein n=1 Tax=unclassified Aliivibrio TaxID=2645654 RepID=UPI0023789085|nr:MULTISPECIES: patatin-like phospholipase family protein [unclassified Aliivibrio]MDD9158137.1 patatin-like phospholipase family protein [Aliivibrio sp. S4TY2]MDD9162052.1 patatin-like phospholipase family protein [Aliivibrio sp. S4TY1]MDD9166134.1 patatin-like phospholipase family protein [Aliivibrio sp. S4MY2]MDD9170132.1 patatin-like phospholipase family protein [Aliivibrio sp. S4MY4]MDD9187183.1 patatin-like phospholipase family protein [Aliivibrio sp. S4MY3]
MRFKPLLFPSIFLYLSSSVALADETRPKIGLVLAGGGAKGAAHIGVLKALEEMKIPIDYITGTSMGAYIGGLYASGLSADEIEIFIDTIDWNSGFVDKVERSERQIRDKEYEDRYQIGTDIGFSFTELKAPKGFVQGQNMAKILRTTSGNVPYLESFDDLPIPFRAVATDIEKLEPVILDHGNLAEAMMASMSVPGALPPVEYEGRLLVDGGSVNNMPVDIAREMGADIIIAVDIGSDYLEAKDISSYLSVMGQLTNYIVKNSTLQQEKLLGEKDILLSPHVGKMETAEFDRMPFAYDKGYDIAYEKHKVLDKLVISEKAYQAYSDNKYKKTEQLIRGNSLPINKLQLENKSLYTEKMLLDRLNIKEGQTYTADELEAHIRDLYVIDRFERVDYYYKETSEGTHDLVVEVKEKSWGPNYLDFRFALEDDFDNQSKYSLGMSINFTDIELTGFRDNRSELRVNFELGTDKLISAELYTPFLINQLLFTSFKSTYSVEQKKFSLSGNELSSIDNDFPLEYSDLVLEAAFGLQGRLWSDFRIGGRYTKGDVAFSSISSIDASYTREGVFAQYRLDTLDNYTFPTKGFYVRSEYLYSHDNVDDSVIDIDGTKDSVIEFTVNTRAAWTYYRHTFVGNFEYGVVENKKGDLQLEPKSLGGFLRLSGTPKDSLTGQNLVFTSLVYRYRLMDNDFGLFQSPIYLGASVENGGLWNEENFSDAPIYTAGSIFAGIDSPIGPIIFAYGRTEQNHESVYLSIGATL